MAVRNSSVSGEYAGRIRSTHNERLVQRKGWTNLEWEESEESRSLTQSVNECGVYVNGPCEWPTREPRATGPTPPVRFENPFWSQAERVRWERVRGPTVHDP